MGALVVLMSPVWLTPDIKTGYYSHYFLNSCIHYFHYRYFAPLWWVFLLYISGIWNSNLGPIAGPFYFLPSCFSIKVLYNSSQRLIELRRMHVNLHPPFLSPLDGREWSDSLHGHSRRCRESIPSIQTHSLAILSEVTQHQNSIIVCTSVCLVTECW